MTRAPACLQHGRRSWDFRITVFDLIAAVRIWLACAAVDRALLNFQSASSVKRRKAGACLGYIAALQGPE